MPRFISLVVFDGDDTLWSGPDGGFVSGSSDQDAGSNDFTFSRLEEGLIQRSDGLRFRLFPEVWETLHTLEERRIPISLASYNHPAPVLSALEQFGIRRFFRHAVIEWGSHKDRMINTIVQSFRKEGLAVSAETTLFIDDDRFQRYRSQMQAIGAAFLQKDVDIHDLRELFARPEYRFVPPKPLDKAHNPT